MWYFYRAYGSKSETERPLETALLMAVCSVLGFMLIDWISNIAPAIGTALIAISFVGVVIVLLSGAEAAQAIWSR